MLSIDKVKEAIENGRESECMDSRDYGTLTEYFPVGDWKMLGFSPKDDVTITAPKPWTKENIIKEMNGDNDFGFEKALNQRGLSSGFQYESVKLWLWILEDPLQHSSNYAQYGLPLFKAVALKYGFKNEIGKDTGSERKYASE